MPAAIGTKNGQTYAGWIRKADEKPARLQTADDQDHTLADFDQVRFLPVTKSQTAPSRLQFPFLVAWNRWEHVVAMPLSVTEREIRWSSPLGEHGFSVDSLCEIAASTVADFIWTETFDNLSSDWQFTEETTLSTKFCYSAPTSASLSGPKTTLTRMVDPPLAEGRFSFYFFDSGTSEVASRWAVTLNFEDREEQAHHLKVEGGWAERAYRVQLPEILKAAKVGVPRATGWHQCEIEFGENGLMVRIDAATMVAHRQPLEMGLLKQVEFRRMTSGSAPENTPGLWLDDIMLASIVRPAEISFADPAQTQLLDSQGDQWMGTLKSADAKRVMLRLTGGFDQSFPWKNIRLLRMPSSAAAPKAPLQWEGEIGRVVTTAATMMVELHSADSDQWHVRHPLLGHVTFPTSTMLRYEPRIVGRRQEILPGPYHLGNKVVADFCRPVADGTTCRVAFTWVKPREDAWLTLYVEGLEGTGALAPYARKLKRGEMATELWLNDQRIESLNTFLPLRPPQAVELRIPLPKGALREGENLLEFRQLADSETGFHDEVEISLVAIEESRPMVTRESDSASDRGPAKGQP